MAIDIKDIQDAFEYNQNGWESIRREAKLDMRFVSGDPWDDADKKQRKDRPSIAPEEMSQYRNQVVNGLMAQPRGMKFSPTGNGANDKAARFYENKAREIEYRSNAKQAYILAADNALQRSYGYVRVNTRRESPRSMNQEIWIEGFPQPDMVLPDFDSVLPDLSDMRNCFVYKWVREGEFKKQWPKAMIRDFRNVSERYAKADRVLMSEFWSIDSYKRKLVLATVNDQPQQAFLDEIKDLKGVQIHQDLDEVDYPKVYQCLTNGVEILDETKDWPGKYIPIVSCFGKVLYMDDESDNRRIILSMTRFGRDPWKAYCYACSQELEVLAMVPKAPVVAYAGQLEGYLTDWEASLHTPKAVLFAHPTTAQTGEQVLPLPQRLEYLQAQYLQGLEITKESLRRAIQSAMGSNFLPTQAQKRNEKSGKALDTMEASAARGTYHFIYAYEDMIRRVGVIIEDLIDKIYDYRGKTGVIEPDGASKAMTINDPTDPDAISTKGDYLMTVSTAPSSESERSAAEDFTDNLIGGIDKVAAVAGPPAAAAVMAQSIRMRNLGPIGDKIADIIEPQQYKQDENGQQPNPELMQAHAQMQQMGQALQQAAVEKQGKVIENQGKLEIVKVQEAAETQRSRENNEVKMAVAAIGAKVESLTNMMQLFLEERDRVGARVHEAHEAGRQHAFDAVEAQKDRAHEARQAQLATEAAVQQTQMAHDSAMQQAALNQQGAEE